MIDALSRLGPTIASLAAVLVASLVYRLNADKLFLDMLNARRDAAREVLDAAQARADESVAFGLAELEAAAYNLPAQARFWRAMDAVEGLFGPEVGRAIRALDQALGDVATARFEVREIPDIGIERGEALRRHAEAVQALGEARTGLSERVKPYTNLGRRGLRLSERMRLERAAIRSTLRKGSS